MAGRPTKYDDAIAKKIANGVGAGLTNKDAALVAGIHEDTLANWEKKYSAFSALLVQARAMRSARWLAKLQEAGAKDWRAYAELLDRCAPEYRKVQKTEQTITVEVRHAAEKVAAELGVPVDVVLAETYRMVEDGSS